MLSVIQTLLSAREPDEVRAAIAHGLSLVAAYETLWLYEARPGAPLELTLQSGEAPRPDTAAGSVTLPLQAHGELIGVVVLRYAHRPAIAEETMDALRTFSEFAAVALANALARAELHGYAYTDSLTGLANRRALERELARLHGTEVSLLLVDFDGLKAVNDALGFDRGDALLQAVASTLAASARRGETVARFGGDEFVVVMPQTDSDAALRRAHELTAALDELTLPADLAKLFRGASIGAATAAPGEELWGVLHRASAEMRSRKRRRKSDRLQPKRKRPPARADLDDGGDETVEPPRIVELGEAARPREELPDDRSDAHQHPTAPPEDESDPAGKDLLDDIAAIRKRELDQPGSSTP
jgi:diguanylate cyclase (GGDEF)-like protein